MSIAASGQFDFDHFAAKITEETARVGAGDMAADIDAGKSFERSGNHGSSYVRFVLLRHSRGTLEFRFEGRDSNRATRMAFRALSNDDRYKLAYRNQKSFSSLEIRQGSSEI
jgi:hypothetical protein